MRKLLENMKIIDIPLYDIFRKNMGSYEIEDCDLRKKDKPKLSCHILPSVNIR